jgi:hypothetical protein
MNSGIAPALRLAALRAQLYRLLANHGTDATLAHHLGLQEDAARALCWFRQRPALSADVVPCITLGFDDSCPGTALPRHLKAVPDGPQLPVRAVRARRHAAAHTWVLAENQSHAFLKGSLGAVLRRTDQPSRLFGLTAGHVFGAAGGATSGDTVRFAFDGESLAPMLGRLLDWQPNFARLPVECAMDAGIAEISAAALEPLAARPDAWPVAASSAFADDRLRLRTRNTEIGGGGVEIIGAWLCLNGDTARAYLIRDAIHWRSDSPTQGGDSGAPVWNAADELVGIHAGGQVDDDPKSAIAVPIARILRWAGSDLVRRGEPLRRLAATRGAAVVRPLPVPAGIGHRNEADVLARTLYGEARGEGQEGMAAVGHVVLNRVAAVSWWGRDVIGVCQKPWQFSCWNLNDRNRAELLRVSAAAPRFRLAQDTAGALLAAQATGGRARNDPTDGATHYYARRLIAKPRWAQGRTPCAQIGGHDFFRGIG